MNEEEEVKEIFYKYIQNMTGSLFVSYFLYNYYVFPHHFNKMFNFIFELIKQVDTIYKKIIGKMMIESFIYLFYFISFNFPFSLSLKTK